MGASITYIIIKKEKVRNVKRNLYLTSEEEMRDSDTETT